MAEAHVSTDTMDIEDLMTRLFKSKESANGKSDVITSRKRKQSLDAKDEEEEQVYQARFTMTPSLSIPIPSKTHSSPLHPTPLSLHEMEAICHPHVLLFLAPHDILALWRTCSSAWRYRRGIGNTLSPWFLMAPSVFSFFRLSCEVADHVAASPLSWKQHMGPLLVQLSEYLVDQVYGRRTTEYSMEIDVVHRVVLAEQTCYHAVLYARNRSPEHRQYYSRLAYYDKRYMQNPWIVQYYSESDDEDDDGDINEDAPDNEANHHNTDSNNFKKETVHGHDTPKVAVLVPTLQQLHDMVQSRDLAWGDVSILGSDNNVGIKEWVSENQTWMKQECISFTQATTSDSTSREDTAAHRQKSHWIDPSSHCCNRIVQNLHPLIWIAYDTGAEREECMMTIGPNGEQGISSLSSYYLLAPDQRHYYTHSFYLCNLPPHPDFHCLIGFVVGFIFSKTSGNDSNPGLGGAIWCMRHGLQPFDWDGIDWHALIRNTCAKAHDGPTHAQFFEESLTLQLYGPACYEKYL
jgi:hypothetical protein